VSLFGLGLAAVGVAAGAVTTLAGAGGGVMLMLALGAIVGPHAALAVTSPALLASNLHRAWLFRGSVDLGVARRFLAGAVPAALVGGVLASRVPEAWVRVAMVVLTLLAVLRSLRVLEVRLAPAWMVAGSALVGLLSASAGAAGFLVAPLVMAAGLSGTRYMATIAVCGTALHAARVAGYGIGGLLSTDHLVHSIWLLAGLVAGNALGKRLRARTTARVESALEIGAVVVCTALAVAGVV
jgi:hypothetical protein